MGGRSLSSVGSVALLEAPGFLMLNYGRATPLVNLIAHAAYGAIVGGSCRSPTGSAGWADAAEIRPPLGRSHLDPG